MQRTTLPKLGFLSLLLALLFVLSITVFSYRAWTSYHDENNALAKTRSVVDQTDALLSNVKDAETGQRGFLLTGDDRYLEPYRKALAEIPGLLESLRKDAGGQREQVQKLDGLKLAVDDKLDELQQTIQLRQRNDMDSALAVVRSDRGKGAMDQIRALCAAIQTASYSELSKYSGLANASANGIALVATAGSVILFVLLAFSTVSIQDGTRRRQRLIEELQTREKQIREARDWLQTTIGSIGDAVIATNAAGNITFLNRVAESLTGWPEDNAIGMPLDEVFVIHNEETGEPVENPVSKALRENGVVGLANHTRLTSRQGRTIPIDDSAAPIRDSEGGIIGVVLVFRDVTERRETERLERQATAALGRHAELLERTNAELQHFAYAASHDLREPLRTITIYSEILRTKAGSQLNEKNQGYLEFIAAGARRMGQLLDALLEYSQAGSDAGQHPAPVSMSEVLKTALANLSGSIEESKATIIFDEFPSVMGNEIHFAQILQNLIGNALKYRRQENPCIQIKARKEDNVWLFSVADNGQGIEPAYQSKIFDLFTRLHGQEYPGTGIGLATCKKTVERYGGNIWVESQPGVGSTFYFTLPEA